MTEMYKRFKSEHVYLRRKVGLGEENLVQEKKLESGTKLGVHVNSYSLFDSDSAHGQE